MRNPSLPLKIALVFSLSVAVSSSSSSSNFFFSRPSFSLKSSSSSAKSTAADLLSVLGSREQAAAINRKRANDLRSCLRFLVPFCPNNNNNSIRRRVVITGEEDGRRKWSKREENEMVWWPPEPVLELARLAVDSAGDPDAIYRALDPTVIPVPNVDGYREDKCELTRTPYGRRFINQELNSYLAFLFEMIVARGPSAGLNVSLSRYDLFHGHLFLATDSGRLGILFHAKEYPAYEEEVFPYNMGYCQRGSNVIYDDEMNLRNILWLAPLPCNVTKAWVAPGVLVILDANPEGVIYKDLVPEYVDLVRTIYEGWSSISFGYYFWHALDIVSKFFFGYGGESLQLPFVRQLGYHHYHQSLVPTLPVFCLSQAWIKKNCISLTASVKLLLHI